MKRLFAFTLVVLAGLAVAGCALTKRSTPMQVRYYSLEPRTTSTRAEVAIRGCEYRVRIGKLEPDAHLREKIAHRVSSSELALYDQRRWTDVPDAYVRRSLVHALFEQRPFDQALSGVAPTLDIELTAFEEIHTPRHGGRVQLRYRLHDDNTVLASDVITIDRPAKGTEFSTVVDAIGEALDAATSQLADQLVRIPAIVPAACRPPTAER